MEIPGYKLTLSGHKTLTAMKTLLLAFSILGCTAWFTSDTFSVGLTSTEISTSKVEKNLVEETYIPCGYKVWYIPLFMFYDVYIVVVQEVQCSSGASPNSPTRNGTRTIPAAQAPFNPCPNNCVFIASTAECDCRSSGNSPSNSNNIGCPSECLPTGDNSCDCPSEYCPPGCRQNIDGTCEC